MPESVPFIEIVRDIVRARGSAPAIDDLRYADLWLHAGRVAHAFSERGVRKGERVAIFCENRIGFILAYLACLRLGAIAVPTNVLYRATDFGNILSDAEPLLVVGSAQTRPHVPDAVPFVDAAELEGWALDSARDADPEIVVTCDDIAIIIYTSGTTGRAKGAMITHGNLGAIARQVGAAWRWSSADTLLLTLPLFHVHGLGAGLNGTLAAGAHAILRERFDVNDVASMLRSGTVTMFFGVPTMYVRFIEKLERQTFDRVRLFVSGSAALPADVHRAFEERFGASILERYGSTEFGFPLGNRYDGPRIVGSVGVPMSAENHITIVAPGTLDPVDAGEVGELLVSGPNVCAGYWRRPDASDGAFVMLDERRWFRSGDLFRYDTANGVYVVMGRLKELIISGGFNIYPLEVEAEMRLQPGVRDAALVAMPDPGRGEVPVAFLEVDPGFSGDAFLAGLRERLASFKVPKAVHVVETLPRNAMGKVEKQRLIASFSTGSPLEPLSAGERSVTNREGAPPRPAIDVDKAIREYELSRDRYVHSVRAAAEARVLASVDERRRKLNAELENLRQLAIVRGETRTAALRAYQQRCPQRVTATSLQPPTAAEKMANFGVDKLFRACLKAVEESTEVNEIMRKRRDALEEIDREMRAVLQQHNEELIRFLETPDGLANAFKRDPLLGVAHARMKAAIAQRDAASSALTDTSAS